MRQLLQKTLDLTRLNVHLNVHLNSCTASLRWLLVTCHIQVFEYGHSINLGQSKLGQLNLATNKIISMRQLLQKTLDLTRLNVHLNVHLNSCTASLRWLLVTCHIQVLEYCHSINLGQSKLGQLNLATNKIISMRQLLQKTLDLTRLNVHLNVHLNSCTASLRWLLVTCHIQVLEYCHSINLGQSKLGQLNLATNKIISMRQLLQKTLDLTRLNVHLNVHLNSCTASLRWPLVTCHIQVFEYSHSINLGQSKLGQLNLATNKIISMRQLLQKTLDLTRLNVHLNVHLNSCTASLRWLLVTCHIQVLEYCHSINLGQSKLGQLNLATNKIISMRQLLQKTLDLTRLNVHLNVHLNSCTASLRWPLVTCHIQVFEYGHSINLGQSKLGQLNLATNKIISMRQLLQKTLDLTRLNVHLNVHLNSCTASLRWLLVTCHIQVLEYSHSINLGQSKLGQLNLATNKIISMRQLLQKTLDLTRLNVHLNVHLNSCTASLRWLLVTCHIQVLEYSHSINLGQSKLGQLNLATNKIISMRQLLQKTLDLTRLNVHLNVHLNSCTASLRWLLVTCHIQVLEYGHSINLGQSKLGQLNLATNKIISMRQLLQKTLDLTRLNVHLNVHLNSCTASLRWLLVTCHIQVLEYCHSINLGQSKLGQLNLETNK